MSDPSPAAEPFDRYTAVRALYGPTTFDAIQRSRVLVVGAGGIGCELLKTLVLTGFIDLTVIDLDTIDVSNLNRQFLFRRQHVGQSKAHTARQAVLQFNPSASIIAHHANVKESQFSSSFFSSFTLVLNALDNIDARRHVNRLCLAANVPLIESGTQSTSGQVFPILPHHSECYECNAIASPKTYAVCTIRSTPDRDVHCVVWAKYVFEALFGPEDEGNVMNDLRSTLSIDLSSSSSSPADRAHHFTSRLVDSLFVKNIEKQLETPDTWKNRKPPIPLSLSFPSSSSFPNPRHFDQQVLSPSDTLRFLLSSFTSLFQSHSSSFGALTFDKDDDTVMDVITALANLRMINFHIPQQSRFKVKGIAGNIVHAIATTNAVAAGLIVMEAVKLLSAPVPLAESNSRQVYISPYKPYLLQPQPLDPPRPTCYICSHSTLTLRCDPSTFTLRQLYDAVLIRHLAFLSPSIDVFNRDNALGVKEDCEGVLDRVLDEVKCGEGAMMRVEDEGQEMEVVLIVKGVKWEGEEERERGFEVVGKVEGGGMKERGGDGMVEETGETKEKKERDEVKQVEVEDDDELEIVEEPRRKGNKEEDKKEKTRKRLHSPDHNESKRMRVEEVID